MKVENDPAIVKRELERRGLWKGEGDTHRNRTILRSGEVFRIQRGYSDPTKTFMLWVRFDPGEEEELDTLVGICVANSLGLN